MVWDRIREHARVSPTGVSLAMLVTFANKVSPVTMYRGAMFLRKELPIRLAHRALELRSLPHGLSRCPSVQRVLSWYLASFRELTEFSAGPISWTRKGEEDIEAMRAYNVDFTNLLERIKRRHDPTPMAISQGINELKKMSGVPLHDKQIQEWLDRFYLARIGVRMLITQQISLTRLPPRNEYVGIVCKKTNVEKIAKEAINNARHVCAAHYAVFYAPAVELHCPEDLNFVYVPSHLHHMLFELVKNSLRAVVEKHCDLNEWNLKEGPPKVKVIVSQGREDISVKISDEGGGLPRSGIPLIWTYLYTTAETPSMEEDMYATKPPPMAGFGYGLPLTRLYARYLGGDLSVLSMEGYGTDVYLHLCRLSDSREALPT